MIADYKKLLLATDFSEHSEAAALRAMDIARRNNASLILFHVVEVDAPQVVPAEWVEKKRNEGEESFWVYDAKKRLAEFASRMHASEATQVVCSGLFSPKRDILKYANENDIDLIIMGTHGRYALEVIMGSTAVGVVHRAKCDVLTVRI